MRLIILLFVVVVIGLVAARQLQTPPKPADTAVNSPEGPPAVPTQPQGLQGFERDMSQFQQDAVQRRQQHIDEAAK